VSRNSIFQYRLHDSVSKVTNGQDYQKAFFMYLDFLKGRMEHNVSVSEVFDTNGYEYMMYFCESLSHKILKTPAERREITVEAFLHKCRAYAGAMLPGQEFDPLKKRRIALALWFDKTSVRRSAFKIIKQIALPFMR